MTAVTLTHLRRDYGVKSALRDLSLQVGSGQMVALLGPSGCGKTTALKIIAGLDAPTAGDVAFDGVSVLDQSPAARGAVMVFQNHLLFPHMTVAENIGFGLRMRKEPKRAPMVAAMLDLVQLQGLGARKPSELSGGQAQRAALARALILRPKVLLLDEPLSNLDANLRHEMRGLIRKVQRDMGLTTILVTHDQEEAVVLADQIALIQDGSLQQFGAPQDFFGQPRSIDVARFFGGVNFVAGQGDGRAFHCSLGALPLPVSGRGVVTIRPENIVLGGPIKARLLERQYLGTSTRLQVAVGAEILEIITAPKVDLPSDLTLDLPAKALWFIPDANGSRHPRD